MARQVYRVVEWPKAGGPQWLVQVHHNRDGSECFFPLLQLEGREDHRTAEEIVDAGFKALLQGGT